MYERRGVRGMEWPRKEEKIVYIGDFENSSRLYLIMIYS